MCSAVELTDVAVLIADVSGFSSAESTFEREHGSSGIDAFSTLVNAILGKGVPQESKL